MTEKQERTLLLVEDDSHARESWTRDVVEHNDLPNMQVRFELVATGDASTALQILRSRHIDCAVVDLRIPDSDNGESTPNAAGGNRVVQSVLVEVGIPTVVYSGHAEEASESITDSSIKLFSKQGGTSLEILSYLSSRATLMEAMAEMRTRVATATAKVFSQSIWPRWENRWGIRTGSWDMADVITRQVVSYVAEHLGYSQLYHPEEFYFNPPLSSERLGTGDLVRIDSDIYLLVNPRCNMDRCDYPSELALAYCKPLGAQWVGLVERSRSSNPNKREKALEEARRFASQDHSLSKHFIPSCDGDGPWLVDFANIRTVPSDNAGEMVANRLASVSPQFLPNLVQRYSSYLGRIGQPDLDCGQLVSAELQNGDPEH